MNTAKDNISKGLERIIDEVNEPDKILSQLSIFLGHVAYNGGSVRAVDVLRVAQAVAGCVDTLYKNDRDRSPNLFDLGFGQLYANLSFAQMTEKYSWYKVLNNYILNASLEEDLQPLLHFVKTARRACQVDLETFSTRKRNNWLKQLLSVQGKLTNKCPPEVFNSLGYSIGVIYGGLCGNLEPTALFEIDQCFQNLEFYINSPDSRKEWQEMLEKAK